MFKLFYILKLKFEIYGQKIDNAFAQTVADGFKKVGETKLAEAKVLYEEVDERKKVDSHKREDRDKIKDLEIQINTINGEIDSMVEAHGSVTSMIQQRQKEIETWKEKIKFAKKWKN